MQTLWANLLESTLAQVEMERRAEARMAAIARGELLEGERREDVERIEARLSAIERGGMTITSVLDRGEGGGGGSRADGGGEGTRGEGDQASVAAAAFRAAASSLTVMGGGGVVTSGRQGSLSPRPSQPHSLREMSAVWRAGGVSSSSRPSPHLAISAQGPSPRPSLPQTSSSSPRTAAQPPYGTALPHISGRDAVELAMASSMTLRSEALISSIAVASGRPMDRSTLTGSASQQSEGASDSRRTRSSVNRVRVSPDRT